MKFRTNDRAANKALAHLEHALGLQHRHARRAAGATGRAVDLARTDHHRVGATGHAILVLHGCGDLAEGNMRPVRVQRVDKPQLFVGGTGDFQADFNDISGFIRADRKAQLLGIGEHEAVTAIGRVDLERAQAFDLDPGVQAIGEGGHVFDLDPLHLAVAAVGHRLDQAAGGFEHQPGLRLGHRQDAAVEQHRGHAHRVGP